MSKAYICLLLAAFQVIVASGCIAEEMIRPVTIRYAGGRRGYDGVVGKWLIHSYPDHGGYRSDNDLMIGQHARADTDIFRSLIKFENLDIPADAKITSAELSFKSYIAGRPSIAVYGMLKDWAVADSWAVPSPGGTTWNSQYHGQVRWGAPGADKASDEFIYDGEADRLATPDDVLEMETIQRLKLDVTRSFTSQHASGKHYGWLLMETGGRADTYANGASGSAQLTVTYLPASVEQMQHTNITEPALLTFRLAQPSEIIQNLKRVNELPFDGAVFHGYPDGGGVGILNAVFGPAPLDMKNYRQFIEDVKAVQAPPSRLTHNFLRVNTCVPGTLIPHPDGYRWENRPRGSEDVTMWWDDKFDIVIHNIKIAAEVSRRAGMKGIFLEGEEYGGNIWSYANQKDARELGKTYEETCTQVRKRASKLAQAVSEISPDMTMFVYFHIYREPERLGDNSLWNAFMDGLVEGVDPRIQLVIANSMAYSFNGLNQFRDIYEWDYTRAAEISVVPKKYLRQAEVSFGLWFDGHGWGEDPEFFESAASWQARLEMALAVADRYVWIYTGGGGANGPHWWSGNNLPQQYIDNTFKAVELVKRRKAAE